jgi:hypothetical protein
VERLVAYGGEVAALVETVAPEAWDRLPASAVWSIGKDAEHLSEAADVHLWIVRRTLRLPAPARRPTMERSRLTTDLSPAAASELLRKRIDEGAALIGALTDDQLATPTRPPRAGDPPLGSTIERVRVHRDAIEAKLGRTGSLHPG